MLSIETVEAGGTRVGLRLPRLREMAVSARDAGDARELRFDEVPAR